MPPGPGLVEDCGTLAFFNLKCRLTKLLNLLPAVHKSRPVAQTPVAQGVCGFFPFDSKQQTCKLHRSALLCLINPSIHRGVLGSKINLPQPFQRFLHPPTAIRNA